MLEMLDLDEEDAADRLCLTLKKLRLVSHLEYIDFTLVTTIYGDNFDEHEQKRHHENEYKQ